MLLQPLTLEDRCCCLFQSAFNILSHLSVMRTPCIIFYFQEHEIMPPEEDNTLVGYTSLIYPDFCLAPLSHSRQPRLLNHDALHLSDLWARKKTSPFSCFSDIWSQRWEKQLIHLRTFSPPLQQEIWSPRLLSKRGRAALEDGSPERKNKPRPRLDVGREQIPPDHAKQHAT